MKPGLLTVHYFLEICAFQVISFVGCYLYDVCIVSFHVYNNVEGCSSHVKHSCIQGYNRPMVYGS